MKKVLLVLFVMLLGTALTAQNMNFTMTGNGARAAGMGYAFTGIADDATAMSWNSAGLTQLHSMEASAVGRFGFGSGEFKDFDDAPDLSYKSKFQINFLSFATPFSVGGYDIVAGIAFRNVMDFNDEETADWESGEEIYGIEGGIAAITPAIGVKINEILSAGMALNFYTGSLENYYEYDGNRSDGSKIDFSGSSFDLGLMAKPNEKISVGANINFPFDLTSESDMSAHEGDNEEKIDRPLFFSIGGAIRATDNLLIAVDYHHQPWSKSDYWTEDNSEFGDLIDLNSIHFGLEYLITSGESVLPIRLGYYTKPLFAVVDEDGDQVSNGVLSFGAGLVMKNFIIDGAFEYEPTSEYQEIYEIGGSYYSINKKRNDMRITIGATMHFGK